MHFASFTVINLGTLTNINTHGKHCIFFNDDSFNYF